VCAAFVTTGVKIPYHSMHFSVSVNVTYNEARPPRVPRRDADSESSYLKVSFLRFEDEIDWDDGPRDVGMVSHMHKAVMSYHQ